jgi:hypothetical protein
MVNVDGNRILLDNKVQKIFYLINTIVDNKIIFKDV